MNLKEKIQNDLKEALKEKNEIKISTLKMLIASIINKEIELGKKESLENSEIEQIIQKEAKKRKESLEAYQKGGRNDLAEKEKSELEIIKTYLPAQLSEEEIEKIAKETINQLGAGPEDFGKIMKEIMSKTKGRAEGKKVSEIVKSILEK